MKPLISHIKSLPRAIADLDYNKRGLLIVFVVAVLISVGVRLAVGHVVTPDFTDYLKPWIEHMSKYGLAGLGTIKSNYNTPYLVLLWLTSFLPVGDLFKVKLISVLFDAILAIGAYLVVSHFRPKGLIRYIAPLAILFAPTVVQNGAMWGQCDVIYTTFIVFAFYAYLKNKIWLSWILWAVAFSFKLQAAFFAPFLIFLTLYTRKGYKGILYSMLTFGVLSVLPLFFGKNIFDIASIYIGQTEPIRTDFGLAWFSPTAYQWVSNANFGEVRRAGVLIGFMAALCVVSLAFLRRYTQQTILVVATASLLAIPFFLPQIHERYLFTSEIFLIITACVMPKFIWAAIAMQIISTMAYITYFTQAKYMPPLPFAELSIGVFVIISILSLYIYRNSTRVGEKAQGKVAA